MPRAATLRPARTTSRPSSTPPTARSRRCSGSPSRGPARAPRRPAAATPDFAPPPRATVETVAATKPPPFLVLYVYVRSALGVGPGVAPAQVDGQRHSEIGGALHAVEHDLGGVVVLVGRHLEDHLVVHLQHQPAAKPRVLQAAVHPDECDLEDVGGQALDAGVH